MEDFQALTDTANRLRMAQSYYDLCYAAHGALLDGGHFTRTEYIVANSALAQARQSLNAAQAAYAALCNTTVYTL